MVTFDALASGLIPSPGGFRAAWPAGLALKAATVSPLMEPAVSVFEVLPLASWPSLLRPQA